ncbi:MAG TPA: MFS transporter [Bosea sp. (in: a-proteobacteria)]|jgi:DHA2 family multidrug resistance protein-like MFS transporter|uniref:MFS transporter n=1 Tax=Bosea sp. (in: a-proteobacteria) TaxID=1871050 RepID=UPI002DDD033D|nr:MFS transporter [Bosea sp. (in: a-proteobacteria)]HEV2556425.1 MFS transporter [Bosea sp. (in: a-proteobacteria)]
MTPAPEITATPAKATRRDWLGLAVIALPCLLYSMDLTVLNLAIPQLSVDLKPSAAQLLWIVDIYGFMVAGSLITMGTLGDKIGRRKLLLIGAAAFGLASILAAFSTSAEMLIATRALLGIAGATLAPSTLSLIRNMFLDPQERTFAIGIWIASFSAGGAIGPLVGGLLLQHYWWGSVFLVGVPVMILLLVLGPFLLPEFKDPDAGRIDLASAALSLAAVLAVIYGIKHMAEHGAGWQAALPILAGLAIGSLFLRRQRRLADPFLDLRLFRNPVISAALAINVLGFLFLFGSFLFIGQYLQLVRGFSPLEAGLWSLPSALAFILGTPIVPVLAHRFRPAQIMAMGLTMAALGFALLSRIDTDTSVGLVVVASVIFSLGFTPVVALTTELVVGSAPPERAGSAAAISETSLEFGGAVGIAVLGSIVTAVYRSRMALTQPAGLAPEAARSAAATLGGAVAEAARLPADLAASLLAAARGAFVAGMQLSALVATVGLVVTAVIAVVLLRRVPAAAAHPA